MNRSEAWRIGDERRRLAQRIMSRCGIEAVPLCALKMNGRGDVPVGHENNVDVIVQDGHTPAEQVVVAVFDDDGNPKACSAEPMSAREAERLRFLVEREAAASAARQHCSKEGDQHATVDS